MIFIVFYSCVLFSIVVFYFCVCTHELVSNETSIASYILHDSHKYYIQNTKNIPPGYYCVVSSQSAQW